MNGCKEHKGAHKITADRHECLGFDEHLEKVVTLNFVIDRIIVNGDHTLKLGNNEINKKPIPDVLTREIAEKICELEHTKNLLLNIKEKENE